MIDDVHIGNNGARLDLADDAAGDDLLQAQRAANRKDSLALSGNSPACLRLGDGRGRGAREGAEIGVENGDVPLRVKCQDFRRDFSLGIELNGDQFRGPITCWLVITRPAESTMKPVPEPISLQTVTTDF